jgi:hypothetical protein
LRSLPLALARSHLRAGPSLSLLSLPPAPRLPRCPGTDPTPTPRIGPHHVRPYASLPPLRRSCFFLSLRTAAPTGGKRTDCSRGSPPPLPLAPLSPYSRRLLAPSRSHSSPLAPSLSLSLALVLAASHSQPESHVHSSAVVLQRYSTSCPRGREQCSGSGMQDGRRRSTLALSLPLSLSLFRTLASYRLADERTLEWIKRERERERESESARAKDTHARACKLVRVRVWPRALSIWHTPEAREYALTYV